VEGRKKHLGEMLVEYNLVTQEQLDSALTEQKTSGTRLGEILVSRGVLTRDDLEWAISNQFNLPYVRLKRDDIAPDAIALVKGELAWKHHVIPLSIVGDELNIAIDDPMNKKAIEDLEWETKMRINVSIGSKDEIFLMLEMIYGPSGAAQEGMEDRRRRAAEVGIVVKSCIDQVIKKLGAGFAPEVYIRALELEIGKKSYRIERDKKVKIYYDGVEIGSDFIDIIVVNEVGIKLADGSPDSIELARRLLKLAGLTLGFYLRVQGGISAGELKEL
jgi:GxxExxY protein